MSEHALLQIRNMCRHYQIGEHTVKALDDVSFNIERGEFVSIVGSSGSGKSTMMNILGCLDSPSSGSYVLSERHIADTDDDTLSEIRNRHIGFVFQQFHLLHELSVMENIALPLAYQGIPIEERQARVRKIAEVFKLTDRLAHKPSELSGGQAQRIAIMRALITQPDILLLDEPTGALDSHTGREIMDIFHQLHADGLTIIMVTHDNELAQESSRIIRLRDGQVIEDRVLASAHDAALTVEKRTAENEEEAPPRIAPPRIVHTGLSWRDLIRIGIHEGLLAHKLRSALTMLGIVIGVASVVAMSSFSLGSKHKQMMSIRELGANLINIRDNRLEGELLNEARIQGSRGLSLDNLAMLRQHVPHIQKISGYRDTGLRAYAHTHTGHTQTRVNLHAAVHAVAGAYVAVNNMNIEWGRDFSINDHIEGRRVVLVGSQIDDLLTAGMGDASASSLGQMIFIANNPYTIIGVLENKYTDTTDIETGGASDTNTLLIVPLSCVRMRTARVPMRSEIDAIQIQLDNEDYLDDAGLRIQRLLQGAHHAVKDFSIEVPLDLLKQKQQSQKLLDVLTLCVSSISLLVGGIGIMNIMLASVTERLKEIGIRRAIGATRHDIKFQFLTESVTLSVAGGIVGIIVSVVLVIIVGALIDIPCVFSMSMMCISVGAAIGTGLIFGLYPAIQASEKSPVEILRNE